MQLQNHNSTEVDMSGGSSSAKGFGHGSGKGGRKGPPIVWEDRPTVGPEFFGEAVYEFPVECKFDFIKDNPLRGYDNRREEWPKCSHGEDCVVQMMTDGTDGGRLFFRCPRAWVLAITLCVHNTFVMSSIINTSFFCFSLPRLRKAASSLDGSILFLFIRIRSTSTTCRIVSSI